MKIACLLPFGAASGFTYTAISESPKLANDDHLAYLQVRFDLEENLNAHGMATTSVSSNTTSSFFDEVFAYQLLQVRALQPRLPQQVQLGGAQRRRSGQPGQGLALPQGAVL